MSILLRIVIEASYILYTHWRSAAALAAVPLAVSLLFELIGEFGLSSTGVLTAAGVGILFGTSLLSALALVPFMVAWHRLTVDGVAPTLGLGAREARYGGCLGVVMVAAAAVGYPLLSLTHVLIEVTGYVAPVVYVVGLLPHAIAALLLAIAAFLLVEAALGRGGRVTPALHATKGLRGRLFLLIVALKVAEYIIGYPIELTVVALLGHGWLSAIIVVASAAVVAVAALAVLVSALTLVWRDAENARGGGEQDDP